MICRPKGGDGDVSTREEEGSGGGKREEEERNEENPRQASLFSYLVTGSVREAWGMTNTTAMGRHCFGLIDALHFHCITRHKPHLNRPDHYPLYHHLNLSFSSTSISI